jgi:hypothetical protein
MPSLQSYVMNMSGSIFERLWLQVPSDPKAWKCEESGATDNLWLNLSTGHIGSGRQVSCTAASVLLITQRTTLAQFDEDMCMNEALHLRHITQSCVLMRLAVNSVLLCSNGAGRAATARPCATSRPPAASTRLW